ncbi:hypothetical protein GGR55DRAFT_159356 [Xylaria sp. FL0064]|nr:hypothetical protein GGR55DRAFT_159356 [Xylaria sp. FL0064]
MDSSRSSSTSATAIPTPTASGNGSTATLNLIQPSPPLPTILPGPLPLTTLSTTSWRTAYPRIGQFAMTKDEQVVAAGPNGLLYFRRVQDHVSKPWSEPRLFPTTSAMLNDQSVSGLAIHLGKERLNVYCVSGGNIYSFHRPIEEDSSFVLDPQPPLSTQVVSGTPAVAVAEVESYYSSPGKCNLIVPCQSGGLLHTWTSGGDDWGSVDHVAKELGVISAVSSTGIIPNMMQYDIINILAVVVASGRLHTVEGRFGPEPDNYYHLTDKWIAPKSTRINHPGEVTGNPALVRSEVTQLDLLVPSAEGGVFHFVRTASTPDEWHMIARIALPHGLPAASCLAFNGITPPLKSRRLFCTVIQTGGQLYYATTYEGSEPWLGSYLEPIVAPGPFSG